MNFNDDINVADLALAIYRYLQKQFVLLSVFVLIGVVVGIGFYLLKPVKFRTEMLANSPVMNNRMVSIFNSLSLLVEDRQYKTLAYQLDIPANVAVSLISISASPSETESYQEGSTELLSFTVQILVADSSVVQGLQTALISFISNNEFVSAKIDLRRKLIEKMIAKIDEEVAELDTLQLKALRNKSTGSVQFTFGESSQTELVNLLTEKNRLLQILQETRPINVIQPFGICSIEKTGLLTLMAVFGFVFLVSGLVVSLFLELRKLAKQAA